MPTVSFSSLNILLEVRWWPPGVGRHWRPLASHSLSRAPGIQPGLTACQSWPDFPFLDRSCRFPPPQHFRAPQINNKTNKIKQNNKKKVKKPNQNLKISHVMLSSLAQSNLSSTTSNLSPISRDIFTNNFLFSLFFTLCVLLMWKMNLKIEHQCLVPSIKNNFLSHENNSLFSRVLFSLHTEKSLEIYTLFS